MGFRAWALWDGLSGALGPFPAFGLLHSTQEPSALPKKPEPLFWGRGEGAKTQTQGLSHHPTPS